jgi:hypothetical protein
MILGICDLNCWFLFFGGVLSAPAVAVLSVVFVLPRPDCVKRVLLACGFDGWGFLSGLPLVVSVGPPPGSVSQEPVGLLFSPSLPVNLFLLSRLFPV